MPRSAAGVTWQCASDGPSKSAARKRTVTFPGVGGNGVAPVAHIIIDAVAVGRRDDLEVVRMQNGTGASCPAGLLVPAGPCAR